MWKAPPPICTLVEKLQRSRRQKAERVRHRLLERPSREDVYHGFRFILGREPENDSAIDAHMVFHSVAELRQVLLNSDEFNGKYKGMHADTSDHPSLSMEREALVFIHMQKTGGTSLRAMLAAQYSADRICPVLEDRLHLLSVAELGRYDFFAGHFDRTSICFIPRNQIKTVTLFREPRARLLSFYRFLKSHPIRDEFSSDVLIRLANQATAEEFFEAAQIRSFSAVFNHYLIALGASFSWFDCNWTTLSKKDYAQALEAAKLRIRGLTALGITERFEQSVEYIFKALELPQFPMMERVNATDGLVKVDARFRQVDPITITPRLAAALEDLTVYDDELYRFAVDEFEWRCAETADSRLRQSVALAAAGTTWGGP